MLDPSLALPGGLFHFRVVVGVQLLEPIVIEADDEEGEEEMVGYYRTYGVTAASAAGALSLVEGLYSSEDRTDEAGMELEWNLELLDTSAMDLPKPIDEISSAGIHFESGRAFFPEDEDGDLLLEE